MKISILHSILRILAIVLGISVASQASAKYFHTPAANPQFQLVSITYIPVAGNSVFGTFNTAAPVFSGILRLPVLSFAPMFFCGGGDHDTTGGDTTGGPGNDSLGGDSGHHGFGDDGHHDDGNDSTGFGNDTTGFGCHGGNGGDTTNWANDTVDCHHHADNDDTTVVTDTNTHTLFGGGQQSIMIKSHGQQANVSLVFTNNLSTSVRISNIALASGRYFTIINGAPTTRRPVTLAAKASITLKVSFNAADLNVHTDQIVVASNSSQSLNTISLKGQQVAASASVANSLPAGVSITMLPNPMTSYLKVDLVGAGNASAVIYDMQGKSVLSTTLNTSEWIWSGTANDGSALPAGTYIVRLSGVSSQGAPFVSTQKIILAR
jgi:hypothetical protein